MKTIPIIDLFAGPGGLSEGFSQLTMQGQRCFKVHLSIEKEAFAHSTLLLRSFVRQFPPNKLPDAYYQYAKGQISRIALFAKHSREASIAAAETLAQPRELGKPEDDRIIKNAVRQLYDQFSNQPRVLIGGPPCQAYSLAGRSRRAREDRASFEQDEKHYLYREYLEIVHLFKPTVFVMENVKGLLSATVENRKMFGRILDDLTDSGYTLYSLSKDVSGVEAVEDPASFVVKAEEYGIPQKRHRIFVVGVSNCFEGRPEQLKPREMMFVRDAIDDLPSIRSHISRRASKKGLITGLPPNDAREAWQRLLRDNVDMAWFPKEKHDEIGTLLTQVGVGIVNSAEFIPGKSLRQPSNWLSSWLNDSRLGGILHHCGRSHMADDLLRYFFVAASGMVTGRSPKLDEFPKKLKPNHANAHAEMQHMPHSDRFKVQVAHEPCSTVTCHISKDGHYYIHPDPTQCRSLTVREAARIQTFPDNYIFEGPRTEQYRQVGNAVPPLLAKQIAAIIFTMLKH